MRHPLYTPAGGVDEVQPVPSTKFETVFHISRPQLTAPVPRRFQRLFQFSGP